MPPTQALPQFPILSAASTSRFILAREANNNLLADLHGVLLAVQAALTSPALKDLAEHALAVTCWETGLGSPRAAVLLDAVQVMAADIEATLVLSLPAGGAAEHAEKLRSSTDKTQAIFDARSLLAAVTAVAAPSVE
mgnify:CR=1 FL=1